MQKYLENISQKFKDPLTSEMGYRTDFEMFLNELFPKTDGYHIHHDAKAVGGNKPDFVVLKNKVPVLYIENKDIGINLDKIEQSNQMDRYFGYTNLILTDQLEFRFYRNGERYGDPIKIAEHNLSDRTITSAPDNFEILKKTVIDFTLSHKEPIKRGKHLAQIMGGKAQRIRANVLDILGQKEETDIHKIRNTIKKLLVHDMDDIAFADMYAQTLVYGLFVARFYDESPDDFSRQEARELVPKSNPFLAHFFDHISGVNFEKRLGYIVDELCEVFSYANIPDLMEQYFGKDLWGNEKEGPDPVIHFYEDFLKEYDPELRKKMGAYYTPTPVVRFMVRAVDEILKKEFAFVKGLADTSKYDNGLHKVQILDPATGTGTFISAVIRHIYEMVLKSGQKGTWPSYVHNDLLPRIHAFELMMGPYTIAHLKLSMSFEKTGFKYFNNRLGIYLTNSLEESIQNDINFGDLGLSGSIAEESKEAGKIKNEKPVMVVIGNPPYSGESMNKDYNGHSVYKFEPGGKVKLNERNPKWINDDYVKFIRFGENLIERNDQGVVAMITAHGYIDNPTFRGMRWHLRRTFDKIYIIDLHGNANKKETTPDGKKDENVFDIKTGVSIIFAIKKENKDDKKLGTVYKADIFGLREKKFEILEKESIENIKWQELPTDTEIWVKEGEGKEEYIKSFSVADIFPLNGVGITTAHDSFVIDKNRNNLINKFDDFRNTERNSELLHNKFNVRKKNGWNILDGYNNIKSESDLEKYIMPVSYRPFDNQYIFYEDKLVWRTVSRVMQHFVNKNIGLVFTKQVKAGDTWQHINITNKMIESSFISNKTGEINSLSPLYLYTDQNEKIPNLDQKIWNKINEVAGETTPENILDYIYAVLHSPHYREKYTEFLKKDFPRVPYPKDKKQFWDLVQLGTKLRELHLMIDPEVNNFNTTFPESGNDVVDKLVYKDEKVYINENQYFGKVSEVAWNFYVGGYQPAQKWLKDRKGDKLLNEDIAHYQKTIKVLVETDKVMKEIDQNFELS